MANDSIDIKEEAGPTKKLASQSFVRGASTVHQEELVIGDGSTDGRIVSVTAASALKVDGSAVNQPVTDAGGSLTVDAIDLDIRNLTHVGSQDSVRIGDGTDLALVTALGEQNVLATAQPGVDIGDVTINNAAGAAGVNIQDGGNSITVDGTVKAREDTVAMTWVSVKAVAPAANAVGADTGALAAGDYDFDIYLAVADTIAVGKGFVVEHRNAANAATLFNLGGLNADGAIQYNIRRYTIALNERIRIIAGTAAGAANSMYISAIGRRVS